MQEHRENLRVTGEGEHRRLRGYLKRTTQGKSKKLRGKEAKVVGNFSFGLFIL
ncbi:MAG: hypothetical protein ACYCSW_04695 [bacterium]|jgi:hypothetical protein